MEEYRVKSDQALGYEWHSAEFFCFWDPVSHKAMCNVFVRQVTEEKMRQLEESAGWRRRSTPSSSRPSGWWSRRRSWTSST